MIPKINKILYTTDLSPNSAYVFRYALSAAEVHDAKIDMLYVLHHPALGFPEVGIAPLPDKQSILAELKNNVDDFVQRELKDNPDRIKRVSSTQVIEGNPAIEILKKVDELKPDILIMGTHSKGLIAHTFLGSVATSVLQHSKIPVFVIPIPEALVK